jgi:methyltransferase (TIGR00027 family)
MPESQAEISHVSDTALMVAACRALETARPDGFVRDPFAERLAGARGMAIARALPGLETMCFGVGARSRFVDELVMECCAELEIRTVLSVGCGLDTRPWRLDLPAGLRWIEVDFPAMLDYKAAVMASERPSCRLERIPADLNDAARRRAAFASAAGPPGLMITEGLLQYLPGGTVEALAAEPAAMSGIRYWLADITSPAFAKRVGLDTFRSVQNVRAAGHMDGAQILESMRRNGWASMKRRSYVTDLWPFGADRLREAAARRSTAEAAPPLAPDDPTGVHVFGRG